MTTNQEVSSRRSGRAKHRTLQRPEPAVDETDSGWYEYHPNGGYMSREIDRDELEQRRRDAVVGRTLREAAAIDPGPLMHVSWEDERGRTRGRSLSDAPLFHERRNYAEAAAALYDAAEEYANG